MYQKSRSCLSVRGTAGWPTESAARRSTRSGRNAAMPQAVAAPQSWPTTAVRSTPSSSSSSTSPATTFWSR